MAALTAQTQRRMKTIASWHQTYRVANSDTLYVGSFCGLPGAQAQTSRRGYLTTYRDEQGFIWAGVLIGESATNSLSATNTIVGDTAASPVVESSVESGSLILEQYTVTGVSAQTDVLRTSVYARNDNDLNTTQSQSGVIGRVLYWYSSTTCDVLIYGTVGMLVI